MNYDQMSVAELKLLINDLQKKADQKELNVTNQIWFLKNTPKEGNTYHYIHHTGNVCELIYHDKGVYSNKHYEEGNCFSTREEAEEEAERHKIRQWLIRFAKVHNERNFDWNDENTKKYYICYNYRYKVLGVDVTLCSRNLGAIYFTSEDIALEAIRALGSDNLKLLLKG